MTKFIHLTNHTEYSIGKGTIDIKKLLDKAIEYKMPAVAITDHMNLFGAVKFFKAAISKGIKPIIGCELDIVDSAESMDISNVIVLCKNEQGYKNLMAMLSKAYLLDNKLQKAVIEKEWLAKQSEGLILIIGSQTSHVNKLILKDNNEAVLEELRFWKDKFHDRLFLEVSNFLHDNSQKITHKMALISNATGIPLLATNHSLFLHKDDYESQCVRVCIHEGKLLTNYAKNPKYSKEQYFKSPLEMKKIFASLSDALDNTWEVAKKCNFILELGNIVLPDFPIPEAYTVNSFLNKLSQDGLESRFKQKSLQYLHNDQDLFNTYKERLEQEISVITKMDYSGYFLIVYDFIRWSKENNIPVGPGRGSGAGSLVAFSLGITDIDPIKYDLLFERFLNPERVSMPDFDIDFCIEGRDKIIDYVADKYGKHNVAQIITFGTMAAKAVVRDVGRVLGHPYGMVDKIAKLIPMELGITLKHALKEDDLKNLYKSDELVKSIIDMSINLEGLVRNAGKHAGGVVIAPQAIHNFTPVYRESVKDNLVTQYDKDDDEEVGLVKFDLLGLKTLTVIKRAVEIINGVTGQDLNIIDLPTDDRKAYDIICACQTTAVFQLESRGMKDLINRLQPDKFEDIIALVALFRPGPLQSGMVDDFINRKHGLQKVEYIHPDLESILSTTYGVILYQEQVMEIARKIGGYTLGKADLLRRAMGKKKPKEMAMQRNIFLQGAIDRGVDSHIANTIFDLMEKFSGYGFNKSHSAAYALLSYQTAWLKANYPAEFMAAVMSCDMENTDKLFSLINECKTMGIAVLPPCVNKSDYAFRIEDKKIRYGLGAIKGIGRAVVNAIINGRQSEYSNLLDFMQRIDLARVTKKNIETFAYAGALDSLANTREEAISKIENCYGLAEAKYSANLSGQASLFADSLDIEIKESVDNFDKITTKEFLAGEVSALGFYLSIHPIDLYKKDIIAQSIVPINRAKQYSHSGNAALAGVITAIKRVITKKGDPMFFVTIDDGESSLDILVFQDVYLQAEGAIVKDRMIKVECAISQDNNGVMRVRAESVVTLQSLRERNCSAIEVQLAAADDVKDKMEDLSRVMELQKPGKCSLFIHYEKNGVKGKLKIKDNFNPEDDIMWNLVSIFGEDNIEVKYK